MYVEREAEAKLIFNKIYLIKCDNVNLIQIVSEYKLKSAKALNNPTID